MQKRTDPLRAAAAALALGSSLLSLGCGDAPSEADRRRADVIQQQEKALADSAMPADDAPAAPPKPVAPLAVAQALQWPGIEARLTRCQRSSNFLSIEIRLANTGSAPVTIADYSVKDATVVDEGTKQEFEVFPKGDSIQGTTGLEATLAPGQETVVFAVFPVPRAAKTVTVKFPGLAPFAKIPVGDGVTPATGPRDRQREAIKQRKREGN